MGLKELHSEKNLSSQSHVKTKKQTVSRVGKQYYL